MTRITIRECTDTIINGAAFQATISFSFAHGVHYPVSFGVPFSPEEEAHLAWYFSHHLQTPWHHQPTMPTINERMTRYGEMLFEQLFAHPSAYKDVQYCIQDAQHVICEIIGSERFHAIHWELLKDPVLPHPFAMMMPVVRRMPATTYDTTCPYDTATFHVLIVSARPHHHTEDVCHTVARQLFHGTSQSHVAVQIDIVRPGTYAALLRHLQTTTENNGSHYYHMVYLDVMTRMLTDTQRDIGIDEGYYDGTLAQQRPPIKAGDVAGAISSHLSSYTSFDGAMPFFLMDSLHEQSADPVAIYHIAQLLVQYHIPLVIVCGHAQYQQPAHVMVPMNEHIALQLLAHGVQNVLMMGYHLSDDAINCFFAPFYAHLQQGQPVSVAVYHARCAMYEHKQRNGFFAYQTNMDDWMVPVLYEYMPVAFAPRACTADEAYQREQQQARMIATTPPPLHGFLGRDYETLCIEKALLQHNIVLLRGVGGVGKTTLLCYLAWWWQATGFIQHTFYFSFAHQRWTHELLIETIATQVFHKHNYYERAFAHNTLETKQAMLSRWLRSHTCLLILDNLESVTGTHLAIEHTLPPSEQLHLRHFLATLVPGNTFILLASRGGDWWLQKGTAPLATTNHPTESATSDINTQYLNPYTYELHGLDDHATSQLVAHLLTQYHSYEYCTHPTHHEDVMLLLSLLDGYPLALEVLLALLQHDTPATVLEELQLSGDMWLNDADKQPREPLPTPTNHRLAATIRLSQVDSADTSRATTLLPHNDHNPSSQRPAHTKRLLDADTAPETPHKTPATVLLSANDIDVLLQTEGTNPPFHPTASTILLHAVEYTHSNIDPTKQMVLDSLVPFVSPIRQEILDTYATYLKQQPLLAHGAFGSWRDIIQELLAQQLVVVSPNAPGYIQLMPPFAFLVQRRAIAPEVTRAIETAFCQCYRHMSKNLVDELDTLDKQERLCGLPDATDTNSERRKCFQQLVQIEYETLEKALDLALAAHGSFLSLYKALFLYLNTIQDYQRSLNLSEMVWQRIQKYPHELFAGELGIERVAVLDDIAMHQFLLTQYTKAEQTYKQELTMIRALETVPSKQQTLLMAKVHHKLGVIAQEQSQWAHAEAYYQQALIQFETIDCRYEQASSYHQLGLVAQAQHQWAHAETYHQHSLTIFIEFDDRYSQAWAYHQLGMIKQTLRRWSQAEVFYKQELRILIDFHDEHEQARTYHLLGVVAQEQHQWSQAEEYYQQALIIFDAFQDRNNHGITCYQLGLLEQTRRNWTEAESYYHQALKIFIETQDRYEQAHTYSQLGVLAQAQRQWQQAKDYYQQVLQIYTAYKDVHNQALTYRQLGMVAQAQRQWMQAESFYQQALHIFTENNNRSELASTYGQLGALARAQRQWQQAATFYVQALELFHELADRTELASTYHKLCIVKQALEEWDEAETYGHHALALYVEDHDVHLQANMYGLLGILARTRHQWAKASDFFLRALAIYIEQGDNHSGGMMLSDLAAVWREGGDNHLLAAIASVLGVTIDEVKQRFYTMGMAG